MAFTIELFEDINDPLEHYIEISYAQMYITDTDHGKGLVFTFNQLVFEFTFITTNFDNEGNTVASEILHQIGNLEADQSIVLTQYFTLGVDTRSGFSFLDFEGEQHWYSFVQQPPMQGKEGFI